MFDRFVGGHWDMRQFLKKLVQAIEIVDQDLFK